MIIKAPAKINICLNVTGKSDDQYHFVDMIMAPLTLHDTLKIEFASKTSINIYNDILSTDETNLCIKAINVMREHFGFNEHFKITLIKRIPQQAGLGGGSSNAAAVIKAIITLLNINPNHNQMIKIARKIGSDVPFFYFALPARIKGTGEKVEPIKIKNRYRVLIVKPKEGLSTQDVYIKYDEDILEPYNIDKAIKLLEEGDDYKLAKTIGNHLEIPAIKLCPKIKEIKEQLIDERFDIVMMSGSGTAVYALVKKGTHLKKVAVKYQTMGYQVFISSIQDYNKR